MKYLYSRSPIGVEYKFRRNEDIIDGAVRMAKEKEPKRKPGVCIPWEEKLKELPELSGDKELTRKIWEDIDTLGYVYIWQCLLSF